MILVRREMTELEAPVAIGKGFQFTLTAAADQAVGTYNVEAAFQTDGDPAQTLPARIPVYVRNA